MNFKKLFKNPYFILLLIFIIALVARWWIAQQSDFLILGGRLGDQPSSDDAVYNMQALNLLEGRGFNFGGNFWSWQAYKVPVYPMFLATIYYLFGYNFLIVKIIQIILAALSCGLVFLIGWQVFNKPIGILAALVMVFYPPHWNFDIAIIREGLFIFFFLVASYLFILFLKNLKNKPLYLSAIFLALAILTRPAIIAAVPLYFLIAAVVTYRRQQVVKSAVIFLTLIILIISPWLIRNQIKVGGLTMEYTGIAGFWSNANPNYGDWLPKMDKEILWARPNEAEGVRTNRLIREGLNNIIQNPIFYFKYEVKRAHNIFFDNNSLTYNYLIILSFIGFFLGLTFLTPETLFLGGSAFILVLTSAVFTTGSGRYRLPIDWIFILYAIFVGFFFIKWLINKNNVLKFQTGEIWQNQNKTDKLPSFIKKTLIVLLLIVSIPVVYANIVILTRQFSCSAQEFNLPVQEGLSFTEIRQMIIDKNFDIGEEMPAVLLTGTLRHPRFFSAGQTGSYLGDRWDLADQDISHPRTVFTIEVRSGSCDRSQGGFWVIYPGVLSLNLQNRDIVVKGKFKQIYDIYGRYGIIAEEVKLLNE